MTSRMKHVPEFPVWGFDHWCGGGGAVKPMEEDVLNLIGLAFHPSHAEVLEIIRVAESKMFKKAGIKEEI